MCQKHCFWQSRDDRVVLLAPQRKPAGSEESGFWVASLPPCSPATGLLWDFGNVARTFIQLIIVWKKRASAGHVDLEYS